MMTKIIIISKCNLFNQNLAPTSPFQLLVTKKNGFTVEHSTSKKLSNSVKFREQLKEIFSIFNFAMKERNVI